jgi:opacity protein-like surface antigen
MRLLILSALLCSGFLYAQTPDSLKTKKWSIGLIYSPDFCFRQKYTSRMSLYNNETEKPKAGMTAGISFLYLLMDRIGIETGLLYSTKGEKVYSSSSSSGNWVTPDGTTVVVKPTENKSSYTYQYLEVPLKINWYAINNKLKLFPSLGVSANVFIGKKTVSEYRIEDGGPEKSTSKKYDSRNIPAVDMALLVGVGLSYDVNKNIFVQAEPAYRQFVRPLVDSPISGRFYSFGLNAGVYFRI